MSHTLVFFYLRVEIGDSSNGYFILVGSHVLLNYGIVLDTILCDVFKLCTGHHLLISCEAILSSIKKV